MPNEVTRQFIKTNADANIRQLALRGANDPEIDMAYALQQIAGRQAARSKLPSWAAMDDIVYPPHLSMEQCSSEPTARYKAGIAGTGDLMVDLTAGFGVDAAWLSQGFRKAVCIEQQISLCAISSHNFEVLGLCHVEVVAGDGVAYLHTLQHADLLFIDPARRDLQGARTYSIADCTPNVLELLDEMRSKADRILIKLSPMLDWHKAVIDLGRQHVTTVHIVSVSNECKELLVEIMGKACKVETTGFSIPLQVVCINLHSHGSEERFDFTPSAIPLTTTSHSPLSAFHFLYEPNASIMKAGCFSLLAERFGVSQIDANSHLFLAERPIANFPGRGFIIDTVSTMNKRELRKTLAGLTQANITARNFPLTASQLRQRLHLQDGGETYIFATTTANQAHLLFVCRKIT